MCASGCFDVCVVDYMYICVQVSHIQISNTLVGYCWHVVKPFIAVLMLYKRVKARHNGGAL